MKIFSILFAVLHLNFIPKDCLAVSFASSLPPGTLNSSLSAYVHHSVKSTQSSGNRRTETYTTPIEGRPWVLLQENHFETTRNNREKTGYSVRYLPSRQNVEKVEIEVWANKDPGFHGFFITPPSTWIGVTAHFALAPYGQNLAFELGDIMANEILRRAEIQNREVSGLVESFDSQNPEIRRRALEELDQITARVQSQALTNSDARSMILAVNQRYLQSLENAKLELIAYRQNWEMVADSLKEILETNGIPLLDPSVSHLLGQRVTLLDQMKTDFNQDVEFIITNLSHI